MSALLTPLRPRAEQEPLFGPPPPAAEPAAAGAPQHGPTLEDVVSGAWEGLMLGAPAACPVCHGALEPRWSAGAGVVGGRCRNCGGALG